MKLRRQKTKTKSGNYKGGSTKSYIEGYRGNYIIINSDGDIDGIVVAKSKFDALKQFVKNNNIPFLAAKQNYIVAKVVRVEEER